jgi:hypothetical protein
MLWSKSKHTHFMFNNFLFSGSRAVFKIMWKSIVEPDRPQMIIWRMRIACWIPNATNTQKDYVIIIAFPLQQWLHECASILHVGIWSFLFSVVYTVIQVSASGPLIYLRNKLYILWTVHRDTHMWERPTKCTIFFIIYFTFNLIHIRMILSCQPLDSS